LEFGGELPLALVKLLSAGGQLLTRPTAICLFSSCHSEQKQSKLCCREESRPSGLLKGFKDEIFRHFVPQNDKEESDRRTNKFWGVASNTKRCLQRHFLVIE